MMNTEQTPENSEERINTEESEPVKRNFTVNQNNPPVYEQKSGGKKLPGKILIIAFIILLLGGAYLFVKRLQVSSNFRDAGQPAPSAADSLPSPDAEFQPVLERSQWSLEILNGSGVTGAARKTADKIQALGYPVVKTGNADKDTYTATGILVRKELADKVDLVIADLKDTIKIASVAGELQDSTASARIIIGKDSI